MHTPLTKSVAALLRTADYLDAIKMLQACSDGSVRLAALHMIKVKLEQEFAEQAVAIARGQLSLEQYCNVVAAD